MQSLIGKIGSLLLISITFVAGFLGFTETKVPVTTLSPVVRQSLLPVSNELDIQHLEETVRILKEKLDQLQNPILGASFDVGTVVALFETSLANSITSSQTSMTLVSALTKDGTLLASSTYPFIIDEGTAAEEFVLADCTGTACTNMTRGISVLTGTTTVASLQKAHRRGASVKITDGPQLMILTRLLNGQGQIPNVLKYKASTPACTADDDICDRAYINGVVASGAPDSGPTTKGLVEKASAAEAASGAADGSGNTTAPLALTSSIATSTCQAVTPAVIVASSTTGKLPGNCLDLTYPYVFTAKETFSATTSLSGATSTPLIINGIQYAFPSTAAASSTILMLTGGTQNEVQFSPAYSRKIYSTTQDVTNTGTASSTSMTFTLPANYLGTTGVLHIQANYDTFGIDPGNIVFGLTAAGLPIAYASSTSAQVNTNIGNGVTLDVYLTAAGTTNAQEAFVRFRNETNCNDAVGVTCGAARNSATTIDTTAVQTLTVTQKFGASGVQSSLIFRNGYVELIR